MIKCAAYALLAGVLLFDIIDASRTHAERRDESKADLES
jgi:hypothetical protein